MNPLLATFLRLTAVVAVGLIALFVAIKILALVIPIVLLAAVVAGLIIGGVFLYNVIRRRRSPAGISRL